jgi:elongation factor G
MDFPEPVISLAIEPKTKGDQEKLGQGLGQADGGGSTFRRQHRPSRPARCHRGMGELHLEIIVDRLKREFSVEQSVGKPQVAYKETLTRAAMARGATSGRPADAGSTPRKIISIPAEAPGHRLRVRERIVGGTDPEGIHQADRRGIKEALTRGNPSPATRWTT